MPRTDGEIRGAESGIGVIGKGLPPKAVYDRMAARAERWKVDRAIRERIEQAKSSRPPEYYHQMGWVLTAFQNALYELLHDRTLEQAVIKTVHCGGDTDTNGAICGALLGAVYGRDAVPEQWVDCIVQCRPTSETTQPRPREYWPDDALELAERLLGAGAKNRMKGRKRGLRKAMRCIGAGVLTMFGAAAYATETRNCTDDEEHAADRQLLAITEDETRSKNLIKRHLPFGVQIGTHASQGGPTNEKLLVQAGYVTLHDGDLRTALWTAHMLTDKDVTAAEAADRIECFRRDIRLEKEHRAIKKDYEEPIFDRGHMTPDGDLRDDVTEQMNSYVLSNMAPQYSRFNRAIWRSLENRGRDWAKTHETIYVTTGALFDFNPRNLRDEDEEAARMGSRHQTARVAIASHFYKVFLRRSAERWCSIAFVLEHHSGPSNEKAERRLQNAIKPLAFIEERAETTFHPELDRADNLDESLDGSGWGLAPRGQADNDASCRT